MSQNKQKQAVSPEHEMGLTLDDLVRRDARQVIQQAIETELAELLVSCANVRTLQGKPAVVRNGYPIRKNLILYPLNHIEKRDAVLNVVGSEAQWPAVDATCGRKLRNSAASLSIFP